MSNPLQNHPIITLITTSCTFAFAIYFLFTEFQLNPLKEQNIVLVNKIDNINNDVKSSEEYIRQSRKLTESESKIKYLTEQHENYNNILENNSFLKAKKEILVKDNANMKNNYNSFNETCKEELDEFQDRYENESIELRDISYSKDTKRIEVQTIIVKELSEQIKALLSSRCFSK